MKRLVRLPFLQVIRWPESSVWHANFFRYGLYMELGRYTVVLGC